MNNPILIGKAEEIDLLKPEVRKMLGQSGIYLASDSEHPGFTVPLYVNNGRVFSMKVDEELDPERFKSSVKVAGPFYAPGEEVDHG